MTTTIREAGSYLPVQTSSPQVTKIVAALRDEIVSGAIAPGSALGQESLAERFGVSRMPIREAIQHLAAMGFVTIEGNKRSRVAELSLADLIDIYDMRIALEVVAIRAAMPNLTNAQIDQAEEIQARFADTDAEGFVRLNQAINMTLNGPSTRPRLLAQIDTLFNAADRYLCIAKAPPGQREKSDAEHRELLELCRKRDASAAAECLIGHSGDARSIFEKLP